MELFHYRSEESIISSPGYCAAFKPATVNPGQDGVITRAARSVVYQHCLITLSHTRSRANPWVNCHTLRLRAARNRTLIRGARWSAAAAAIQTGLGTACPRSQTACLQQRTGAPLTPNPSYLLKNNQMGSYNPNQRQSESRTPPLNVCRADKPPFLKQNLILKVDVTTKQCPSHITGNPLINAELRK